jgi:hypothetical protein
MHIHDTLQSSATNLLAARNAAFTALLCYAKIKPAALHCGKFNARTGETAGGRPEFRSGNSSDGIAIEPRQ